MKRFQKIVFLLIIIGSIFAAEYATACGYKNKCRPCPPYRDNPDDDDCERTKYSKLFIIISSGDVDLGAFVRGAQYEIEPPDNEIEFQIIGQRAKRFYVVLSTAGSDLGSTRDVSITTEWRFSHDYGCNDEPFISGRSYFFWNKMIVACFITGIKISPTARSGNYSFEQVLTVSFDRF